eukprot:CAMPEP_0172528668 /NCGR_PEP_ID=MMETSP1067-20121228/2989_1 /TAXON_ID=265564 ORGANISM="Thalassiosira punctigera, Strain Tpunct2005C2" /NCGR_SAMPLE_ID=MMETSP1067 /ASSEMBLY_ACC=CAM_ASM_000444 /LENGTH=203 /DNA_ID=CAMNT_0013312623 /DNA_START=37 /DNA_END=648 /DNA_ORIENTATION=+
MTTDTESKPLTSSDHQSSSLTEKLLASERVVAEKARKPILNQHKRDIIRPFIYLALTVWTAITMVRDADVCTYLVYFIWAYVFTAFNCVLTLSGVVFIIGRMRERTHEDEKCSWEKRFAKPTALIFLGWFGVGIWGCVLYPLTANDHPDACKPTYNDLVNQSITTVVIASFVIAELIWHKHRGAESKKKTASQEPVDAQDSLP